MFTLSCNECNRTIFAGQDFVYNFFIILPNVPPKWVLYFFCISTFAYSPPNVLKLAKSGYIFKTQSLRLDSTQLSLRIQLTFVVAKKENTSNLFSPPS